MRSHPFKKREPCSWSNTRVKKCNKGADFSVAPRLVSGPVVQCGRSLTSSCRGRRWLLQGHCTRLINGPSYVAAVCLMSLITTDHTSPPDTHTHTLRVIRPVCLDSHPLLLTPVSPLFLCLSPTLLPFYLR